MNELSELGVCSIGTIRENRTEEAKTTLITIKVLQNKERGIFDYCCEGKVIVAMWRDNAVVAISSNWETHEPVPQTIRRVRGAEQKEFTQPHIIYSYNQEMDGVDVMDRLLASYRPNIKGKK